MLKPKFARVVVEREKVNEKFGNIIIPESVHKDNIAHEYGRVIAVGPECDESIEPGMKVLFGRYAGGWFKHDGEDIYILQDEDIVAEVADD